MEDISPDILTSKMVHEMFHGYQSLKKESRFPNEFEAVLNYKYIPQNLGIKLLENKLIVELLESFNIEKFEYLLSLMKYRYNHFKYEFMYELEIEQIEGSANNVELNALKQLSKVEYQKKLKKMKENILNPENLQHLILFIFNNFNFRFPCTHASVLDAFKFHWQPIPS